MSSIEYRQLKLDTEKLRGVETVHVRIEDRAIKSAHEQGIRKVYDLGRLITDILKSGKAIVPDANRDQGTILTNGGEVGLLWRRVGSSTISVKDIVTRGKYSSNYSVPLDVQKVWYEYGNAKAAHEKLRKLAFEEGLRKHRGY